MFRFFVTSVAVSDRATDSSSPKVIPKVLSDQFDSVKAPGESSSNSDKSTTALNQACQANTTAARVLQPPLPLFPAQLTQNALPLQPQDSPTGSYQNSPVTRSGSISNISNRYNIQEEPLKRPVGKEIAPELDEEPLRRPTEAQEEIRFSDIIAAIAVDVSGSTRGQVLQQERLVTEAICQGLSPNARKQAQVIPWSHYVHPLVGPTALHELSSEGGTLPSMLNVDHSARAILRRCSAWFLLTDGQIDDKELQIFSKSTCEQGIHGTACVIILFGYKDAYPVNCNISVGLAVFSNASDCLFLFHDIDTSQAYILQSKGQFNSLLPVECHELLLNETTTWNHLPKFRYSQLFNLHIPASQRLQVDEIRLQGKKTIDLEDLYHDRVDQSTATKILENDDDLKSVLLAAQLRGHDDKISRWISGQAIAKQDITLSPRPDVESQAETSVRKLLDVMREKGPQPQSIGRLQTNVRSAHRKNWIAFISSMKSEDEQHSTRGTIIQDAISRIAINRVEMDNGFPTPKLLGPVSPSPRSLPNPFEKPHSQEIPPMPYKSGSHASNDEFKGSDTDSVPARMATDTLYIPGYRYTRKPTNVGFTDICPICGESEALLALLLKKPPRGFTTPGFPQPNSRARLAYPLAMGTFPETDVLSTYLCCDPCAYTIIHNKISINEEDYISAIPIMPAVFAADYQQTTFTAIDVALQKRFHKSAVELVFVAILYGTVNILEEDEADNEHIKLRTNALKKACSLLVGKLLVPSTLSMSISVSSPRSNASSSVNLPLVHAILYGIQSIQEPEPPLLQYPVSGFVVMMLIAADNGSGADKIQSKLAVWQRFLFHLIEKHRADMVNGRDRTISNLRDMLSIPFERSEDRQSEAQDRDQPTPGSIEELSTGMANVSISLPSTFGFQSTRLSIRPESLCTTHLFAEEELDEFRRLGPLFESLELGCCSALSAFLHRLATEMTSVIEPLDLFDRMRLQSDLQAVFNAPEEVTEKQVAGLFGVGEMRTSGYDFALTASSRRENKAVLRP